MQHLTGINGGGKQKWGKKSKCLLWIVCISVLFFLSFFPHRLPASYHFHLSFLWPSFGPNPLSSLTTQHYSLYASRPFFLYLFFSKSVTVSFSSTGTTSRRCSLDNRGMAFWEQPSYARCITNEFRYLQQSVGATSASSHSLCFQCIINYLPGASASRCT